MSDDMGLVPILDGSGLAEVIRWPTPVELAPDTRGSPVERAVAGMDLVNTFDGENADGSTQGEGDLPGMRKVPKMMDYSKAAEAERLRYLAAGPRNSSTGVEYQNGPPARETPWAFYDKSFNHAKAVLNGTLRGPW